MEMPSDPFLSHETRFRYRKNVNRMDECVRLSAFYEQIDTEQCIIYRRVFTASKNGKHKDRTCL